MAVTLDELARYLEQEGLKFAFPEDRSAILTGFKTDSYTDRDGDHGIPVVIRLLENGEYFEAFTPRCYQYPPDGANAAAVFQALLLASWMTKLVQFEYDPSDGEIRAMVEWPVEDGTITARQLKRAIMGLAEIVDRFDPCIRKAMAEGVVEPPETPDARAFLRMLEAAVHRMREELGEGRGAEGDDEPLELED